MGGSAYRRRAPELSRYAPVLVGGRFGWNADYSSGKYLRPGNIGVTHLAFAEAGCCAQHGI